MVIRIGLLGASNIAKGAIIKPATSDDEIEIHAIAARNILNAEQYANLFDIPVVAKDYTTLVNMDSIDIVYIGLPISAHKKWCIEALKAGMFSLKFGSALGGALPGYILAATGFVANATLSTESFEGIRFMFNPLPAIFFLLASIVMLKYAITSSLLNRVESDLHFRRNQRSV